MDKYIAVDSRVESEKNSEEKEKIGVSHYDKLKIKKEIGGRVEWWNS